MSNSIDSELEEILNEAVKPKLKRDLQAFINSKYIRRDLVEEAIGDDETYAKPISNRYGYMYDEFEHDVEVRNKFRAELRAKLLNKETE